MKALLAIAIIGAVFSFVPGSSQASEQNGSPDADACTCAQAHEASARDENHKRSSFRHNDILAKLGGLRSLAARMGGAQGGDMQAMMGAMARGGFDSYGNGYGAASNDRFSAADYTGNRGHGGLDNFRELQQRYAGQGYDMQGYGGQDLARLAGGGQSGMDMRDMKKMMGMARAMGIDPRDFANREWRD